MNALDHRIRTGRWDGRTSADALQRAALRLNLGGAAYVRYRPGNLLRESFTQQ